MNKINIDALKKFQHHQKLKQAALTAIAVHLSPRDVLHLKEVFKAIDHNSDGSINLTELKAGIAEMPSSDELIELLAAADTDKNGIINYTEFIAATLEAQIFLREEHLRNAFAIFDVDNSGKIDAKEVISLLSSEDYKDQITRD